jgi:hypothetical protein
MKACRHFKRFDLPTELIPLFGQPWNCFIEVYDERGDLYYSSFETGLYLKYLEHLLESPECVEEVSLTIEDVKRKLEDIEREWRAVVGGVE